MKVTMKPEVRTPGGEATGLFSGSDWIGDLYLIYREGDILTGTVQIDTKRVGEHQVDDLFEQVKSYVGHLSASMNIPQSNVVCIYGDIDKVLEMDPINAVDTKDDFHEYTPDDQLDKVPGYLAEHNLDDNYEIIFDADFELDEEFETAEGTFQHAPPSIPQIRSGQVYATGEDANGYHLTVKNQRDKSANYVLHDDFHNEIGEVAVDQIGKTVSGRVEFWVEPDKGETNEVARLLAKEFADGDVNRISFTMNWSDQHLGDMHLEKHHLS